MTNSNEMLAARIDYVKFVVDLEFDRAQQDFRILMGAISDQENCHLREKDNFKVRALGAVADGQRRRYSVESWGEHAIELAALVPADWFECLARVDYREPMRHTSVTDFDALVNKTAMGAKGKRNIATFDNKHRSKTNTRDVGGKGMFVGSRKSAHMTAAYRRGYEGAYIETRHTGPAARDIGLQVLLTIDQGGPTEWYSGLMAATVLAHHGELYRAFGETNVLGVERLARLAGKHMAQVLQAMEWVETQTEAEYYANLGTEEQVALQEEGWVPTDLFKPRHHG